MILFYLALGDRSVCRGDDAIPASPAGGLLLLLYVVRVPTTVYPVGSSESRFFGEKRPVLRAFAYIIDGLIFYIFSQWDGK